MMKIPKTEETGIKCEYCESRSFTIIFEMGKPSMVCDKCGLPQKEKDQTQTVLYTVRDLYNIPPGWLVTNYSLTNYGSQYELRVSFLCEGGDPNAKVK